MKPCETTHPLLERLDDTRFTDLVDLKSTPELNEPWEHLLHCPACQAAYEQRLETWLQREPQLLERLEANARFQNQSFARMAELWHQRTPTQAEQRAAAQQIKDRRCEPEPDAEILLEGMPEERFAEIMEEIGPKLAASVQISPARLAAFRQAIRHQLSAASAASSATPDVVPLPPLEEEYAGANRSAAKTPDQRFPESEMPTHYFCGGCGELFTLIENHQANIRQMWPQQKPAVLTCPQCGYFNQSRPDCPQGISPVQKAERLLGELQEWLKKIRDPQERARLQHKIEEEMMIP